MECEEKIEKGGMEKGRKNKETMGGNGGWGVGGGVGEGKI